MDRISPRPKVRSNSGQIEWDVMDLAGDVMAGGEKADLFANCRETSSRRPTNYAPASKIVRRLHAIAGVMAYSPSRAGDKYPGPSRTSSTVRRCRAGGVCARFVGEQLEMGAPGRRSSAGVLVSTKCGARL
ncbi:hypothetical protein F2981_21295 (plasmid) [Sinorhizobium meliloti]|nr:hypothetical protein [Sinorhizobium meliloti]